MMILMVMLAMIKDDADDASLRFSVHLVCVDVP